MKRLVSLLACLILIGTLAGCSQETDKAESENPSVDGSKFVLVSEPVGATDVIGVRENAADGDEVVIVGRIGGSANPWVDGQAAFSIVDGSLKACSDIEGDNCPKPWDYCCESSKLPTSTALVKLVDNEGKLLEADARKLLAIKELSTVVVKGKAKRDEAGNLTVLASGIYVKK